MVYVQKTAIRKIRNTIIFFFCLVIPVFTYAETKVSMGNLDDLQAERVLYEAKAALLKAKIAAGGNGSSEVAAVSGPDNNVGNAAGSGSTGVSVPLQSGVPKLSKINGKKAELLLSTGDSVIVTTGAMLPGGRWQVTGVGLTGVTIKDINTSVKQTIN